MNKIIFFLYSIVVLSSCMTANEKKCEKYNEIITELSPKITQYLDTVKTPSPSLSCRKTQPNYLDGHPIYIIDSITQQIIEPLFLDKEVDFVSIWYNNKEKNYKVVSSFEKFCEKNYDFKTNYAITLEGYYNNVFYEEEVFKSQKRSSISCSKGSNPYPWLEIKIYFKMTELNTSNNQPTK